jgi:hypothetical protein
VLVVVIKGRESKDEAKDDNIIVRPVDKVVGVVKEDYLARES